MDKISKINIRWARVTVFHPLATTDNHALLTTSLNRQPRKPGFPSSSLVLITFIYSIIKRTLMETRVSTIKFD